MKNKMKPLYILMLFVLIFTKTTSYAQQMCELTGKITSDLDNDIVLDAIIFTNKNHKTKVDINGNYHLKLSYGIYTITVKSVSYGEMSKEIELNTTSKNLNFDLKGKILVEVTKIADLAKERETPIAFSNISGKMIEDQLASRDLPMILNNTPGVQATQTGGGDGDARITIRGFSQNNMAVMIDGVPVNDMENGSVYWSNWFGLDLLTQSMQVQRGLGISKLAIPSVGGTININTKGNNSKKSLQIKQEIGSGLYQRSSIAYNSGKLNKDWQFSAAFSYKKRQGLADFVYSEGVFFFLKASKKINNHLFSLSVYGAPQHHGQRSYMKSVAYYDTNYAYNLGFSQENVNYEKLVDGVNFGVKHNEFWDYYKDYQGKKTLLIEKENFYFKPQITFNHFLDISSKTYLTNTIYSSFGNGGGTGITGTSNFYDKNTGRINAQDLYNANRKGIFGPTIDPTYHPSDLKSGSYKYASINNHKWVGLLSSLNHKISKNLEINTGIDIRYYLGEHYRKLIDLIGGDYMVKNYSLSENDRNNNDPVYRKGEKYFYYDQGEVRWAGLFGQVEYKKEKFSTFLSVTSSLSSYRAIDFFRKKTLELDGNKYEIGYYDTLHINGKIYDRNSPNIRTYTTDWENIIGYTIKAGGNYNINEKNNIYINLGYLNNAPKFNFVYNQNNNLVTNYKNEKIKALEIGHNFNSNFFSTKFNAYYTSWIDRPTIIKQRAIDNEIFYANIFMDALHIGSELEIAVKPLNFLTLEFLVSIGDWRWKSAKENVIFNDDNGNVVKDDNGDTLKISFDAKNVFVSDAAQNQIGAKIRLERKSTNIDFTYIYFNKYYSEFEPTELNKSNAARQSWKIPAYGLFDCHISQKFKAFGRWDMKINFSILNIFNTLYISDAKNNDPNTQNYDNFDAKSASVFIGFGRTYAASIALNL